MGHYKPWTGWGRPGLIAPTHHFQVLDAGFLVRMGEDAHRFCRISCIRANTSMAYFVRKSSLQCQVFLTQTPNIESRIRINFACPPVQFKFGGYDWRLGAGEQQQARVAQSNPDKPFNFAGIGAFHDHLPGLQHHPVQLDQQPVRPCCSPVLEQIRGLGQYTGCGCNCIAPFGKQRQCFEIGRNVSCETPVGSDQLFVDAPGNVQYQYICIQKALSPTHDTIALLHCCHSCNPYQLLATIINFKPLAYTLKVSKHLCIVPLSLKAEGNTPQVCGFIVLQFFQSQASDAFAGKIIESLLFRQFDNFQSVHAIHLPG